MALSILGSLDNGSDSLSALDENAPREYWLAIAYANGIRVEKNMQIAADYFQKAARMAHGTSQRNLGIMKLMGDDIEKDIPSAYAWLRIATVNKEPIAPEVLKDLTQGTSARKIELGHERNVSILSKVIQKKEKL
ncbi:MAG: hypothetical protein P8P49_11985 [Opitutales bacterium]|nr:hypothetical protein [Opitutales bacterium]